MFHPQLFSTKKIFAPRAQSSTSKTNLFSTSNMQQISTNQQKSRNESQQSEIDQGIPSFDTNVYNYLYNFSTSAGPSNNTQTVYQNNSHKLRHLRQNKLLIMDIFHRLQR